MTGGVALVDWIRTYEGRYPLRNFGSFYRELSEIDYN